VVVVVVVVVGVVGVVVLFGFAFFELEGDSTVVMNWAILGNSVR